MKLIEFINAFITVPFRICQMRHGKPSTLSIIYESVDDLPDGIADKLIVLDIKPAVTYRGPILHIWCYDKWEVTIDEQN